jgi:predicted phage terminase large subunit-like protein
VTSSWDLAAAAFEPPTPRWATPGKLAQELDPRTVQTPALELIDSALVDVAEGRCRRLMVFMPPQEGKSERVARRFVEWLLSHRPDKRVAIASYEQETAERWGRAIREDIATYDGAEGQPNLGLTVQRRDAAAGRWRLAGHEGGVYCVGIGGALTGRPVDVLIVDDPVKGPAEAQSSTHRRAAWDWWTAVARTRLAPDAAVVLIMTRWHEDDLAGRLLKHDPDGWRVISIPALADSPDDPLGRPQGAPLVSARGRTLADWQETRQDVAEYVWGSLYQQRPRPLEGGLFKVAQLRYWHPWAGHNPYSPRETIDLAGKPVTIDDGWRFCIADLAASTKRSADYTVIAAFAYVTSYDLVLLDLSRERMAPEQHLELARPLMERWRTRTLYVEKSFQTATLALQAGQAGIPVTFLNADTDKVTRAMPAAGRVQQGRLWIPAGAPWLTDFVEELAAFPNGAHDDMVDVVAYAERVTTTDAWLPFLAYSAQPRPRRDSWERQMDETFGRLPDVEEIMGRPM